MSQPPPIQRPPQAKGWPVWLIVLLASIAVTILGAIGLAVALWLFKPATPVQPFIYTIF